MTQEEKQLLLKDLCARLPYSVRMKGVNEDFELSTSISPKRLSYVLNSADFKPYLRPMSSMTEEEVKELSYKILQQPDLSVVRNYKTLDIGFTDLDKVVDYLNSHYFDYRGLIEKGLALEAPEDMYKN